jgi:DNA-binding LytR/AlgR family response regulator
VLTLAGFACVAPIEGDLLAALDDAPDVIFCTAFDQYALQAFEVSALDYLQKSVQAAHSVR